MNKVLENSHNTRQALNTLERGYLTLLRLTFEHIMWRDPFVLRRRLHRLES